MIRKSLRKYIEFFLEEDEMILPAHEIKPYVVCFWDMVKGGQNVVSRMLKDVKIDFRCLSPRCFILIRQILTQLLNAHLVLRIINFFIKKNKKL